MSQPLPKEESPPSKKKKQVEIVEYNQSLKEEWDCFVAEAKNSTFLHKRDYMDYHSDRFQDNSLLFYRGGQLIGLLPASLRDSILKSHEGLTYGGVISGIRLRAEIMLEIFHELVEYCSGKGIRRIVYKAIPYIYHQHLGEEDLFAMHQVGGKIFGRDISSTIDNSRTIDFTSNREGSIRKAAKNSIVLGQSDDYAPFMQILADLLKEKFDTTPTHTVEEIELLASRFPENISLHTATLDKELIAGAVVYKNHPVAHVQYIASTIQGLKLGAVELLLSSLIKDVYADWPYFDFGVSTDKAGVLNKSLIFNKESYGARAVCYDSYQIDIN